MDALILVGGRGTRLLPLTSTVPKPMLPVAGVPIIERLVGQIAPHGIDRVVLALGYQPNAFEDRYGPDGINGIPVHYAVEPEPLDTAGAVRFGVDDAGVEGTFWVLNGDVLADRDLGGIERLHRDRSAKATIAVTEVEDPSRFGVVEADGLGRVTGFVEKPPPGTTASRQINAGTYLFEPSVLDLVPPGEATSVERDVFPVLVASADLFAYPDKARWLDLGTPEKLLEAVAAAMGGVDPPCPDAGRVPGGWAVGEVAVQGTVSASLLESGVVVGTGATVRASSLGPSTVVAADADLDEVVTFDSVLIGSAARLRRTIIGNRARIGSGARLEGCVIGDDAVVHDGVSWSDRRHPEGND